MSNRFSTIAAIVAAVFMASPAVASNIDFSNPAFAPVTGPTSIPVGADRFCKTNRGECGPTANLVDAETLTEVNWQQLISINDAVNQAVAPVTDEVQYNVTEFWTYPGNQGDCEDYALEKRRQLMGYGWDASTLLIAVVRQTSGEGHAVLMVRTDRGDLVLDNQDGRVLLWKDTPYRYIKRQSQADSRKWVGIEDVRAPLYTASN